MNDTGTIKVIRLNIFNKRAHKLFNESEIDELAIYLSANPEKGDIIPGTKGLRKLRWSLGNQGKRGGSRIIYYYHRPESLILLLSAYAKNRQEDLNATEKKVLMEIVGRHEKE